MADLNQQLDKVKSKENFFEKIMRIIPGYDGYVNRDNSRELDTLLRNELAKKIDTNHTKLKNTILNLSQRGKLFETDGVDKLDKKIQTATAKFKAASRGYSGAFDVVKIKEEKLMQVYEFDASLLEGVEQITNSCTEMETNSRSSIDIRDSVQKTNELLDQLILKFDARESILKSTV